MWRSFVALANFTATDICLILTAIGGVITSTIAALKANSADKKVTAVHEDTVGKLDTIHSQVNGNLAQVKNELAYHKAITEKLRTQYPSLYDGAKAEVDQEFSQGRRRSADKNTSGE